VSVGQSKESGTLAELIETVRRFLLNRFFD
jgi:hypothetical protein